MACSHPAATTSYMNPYDPHRPGEMEGNKRRSRVMKQIVWAS